MLAQFDSRLLPVAVHCHLKDECVPYLISFVLVVVEYQLVVIEQQRLGATVPVLLLDEFLVVVDGEVDGAGGGCVDLLEAVLDGTADGSHNTHRQL